MREQVPRPSDAVLIKLAHIATNVREVMAADHPSERLRVGLSKIQNERRRTVEKILVLLADPEVRAYLAQVEIKEESR
ncbi:MAG TPA: hypothetical protein VGK28_11820 [Candidatus Dormibacteraeota bacterium]